MRRDRGEQTILFLHGLFGRPDNWKRVMEELSDFYRLIALQLPIDHAPDRRKAGIRSITELTDYVERALDHLGIGQAILCGNSLGGLIAIDFCLRRPRRAEGLVLVGSAGMLENAFGVGTRPTITRQYVRLRASEIFYDNGLVTDELVEEIYAHVSDRNYTRLMLRRARATRDCKIKHRLCELVLPTLIVWGKEDQITPLSVGEEFRQHIPNSRLELLDQCGHSPNIERPKEFGRMLQEFAMDSLRDCPDNA